MALEKLEHLKGAVLEAMGFDTVKWQAIIIHLYLRGYGVQPSTVQAST